MHICKPRSKMKISNITITNIKSFKEKTSIVFDPMFNIIIGPNASGKSNLLDILNIVLRNFFLKAYQLNYQDTTNPIPHLQPISPFQNINKSLDKYLDNTDPSEIEISFVVKKEDLDNIDFLHREKEHIVRLIQEKALYGDNVIQILSALKLDEVTFIEDEKITYKIVDGIMQTTVQLHSPPLGKNGRTKEDVKRELFLIYLNSFNPVTLFAEHFTNHPLKPSLLLLSPYRIANGQQDFQGILSQEKSQDLQNDIYSTTSKTTNSLIKMATTYFSEKRRKFEKEAARIPFEEAWKNDFEVIAVSHYLAKMNYRWDMELIDSNRNVYEIKLEKEGESLNLSQASSGEKEIINYLFGIFALKITNGIIIIDEPELHLHPRWQLLLLELFKGLSKETGNQFVITTHSAVFINIQTVSNLIRIFRRNKISQHVNLNSASGIDVKDMLHLINSTNNEKIFFADIVILVEGITDDMVFQRLFSEALQQHSVLSVVEIVPIMGKGNIGKFRKYLKFLEIPHYFIADLDYVNNVGTQDIKALFKNGAGIDGNVLRNGNSQDGKKLIDILEEAVETVDVIKLKEFISYMKAKRQKIRDDLSPDEKSLLNTFISSRHSSKEYILTEGDIEKYFPAELRSKDLDNVLTLLKQENFESWKSSTTYKLLQEIVESILKDAELIQ